MEVVHQLMMGLSLAACCGFRAWLPMFVMGIMARTHHLELHHSMAFLQTTPILIIFAIAAVAEFCGDKFIVIDHFLDVVGTVARPIAGTLLASSLLTSMDLSTSLILGLIVGGGTAFTMHTGKAVVRAKSSLLAPFHGGFGNAALSMGEDVMSGAGSLLAVFFPIIAFGFAVIALGVVAVMIFIGYHAGRKLFGLFDTKKSAELDRSSPSNMESDSSPQMENP